MASLILYFLAIFGIGYLIRNADGPYDIFAKIRNKLALNKYVGVYFFKLLTCSFCSGFQISFITYLLVHKWIDWDVINLFIWSFAGASFSLIIQELLETLWSIKSNKLD